VKRVAIVTGGASGIGLATIRRLEVVDVSVASFDRQGNEGHNGDNVGQSRKAHAWQKRGNGAAKFLAIIPELF
jgi:NAD(P)-dependent dehydrogenase (short-subunit alcohol dehydrogenase family)